MEGWKGGFVGGGHLGGGPGASQGMAAALLGTEGRGEEEGERGKPGVRKFAEDQ